MPVSFHMLMNHRQMSAGLLATVLIPLTLSPASAESGKKISFSRDVQPLLAKRCFVCHGPADQEGGLALHVRQTATAVSESGHRAIVPGQPENSHLLRRVLSRDKELRMPQEAPPLDQREIDILRTWIAQGAEYSRHWSFQAPKRPTLPEQPGPAIDAFIRDRLKDARLVPAVEADRRTLIRRLSIDLLGLLPSTQRLERFLTDRSEHAYESLVDELLASPHFGERWGRHWLDLARYADSFGYERDDVRPNAWRYRDWVIHSINDNQPYDRFVIEQLAGDLLPEATNNQRIATGLHRMNIKNNESGINKEDYRNRETVDRVNTTATAILGLTLGCAQCHSHKYDPISQKEFYEFYSFFNNIEEHNIDIQGTPDDQARYKQALAVYNARSTRLKTRRTVLAEMKKHAGLIAWQASLKGDTKALAGKLQVLGLTDAVRTRLARPHSELTFGEQAAVAVFWKSLAARHDDTGKAIAQLSVQNRHLPKPYLMTLREKAKGRRTTHLLVRGDFKRKGEPVASRTPQVLPPLRSRQPSADRLDLALWMVRPDNPLAARVAVNHFWKHLFGAGLVSSVDDFGSQGEPPSHPRLLDWLAVELIESGWNRKQIVKTIVLSDTYRQSSHLKSSHQSVDPDNRLLARQSRFRVEAEIVRDLYLNAGGLIHHKLGGPTIHPQTPPSTEDLAYKYKTRWVVSDRPDRYRRGMYIHFKRTNPYPSLLMFDGPESNVCQAIRNRSNTPLQALVTLNDPVFVECAQALGRDMAIASGSRSRRLDQMGRRAISRRFTRQETRILLSLFEAEHKWYREHSQEAEQVLGEFSARESDNATTAAWVAVARAILNLDEFVTRE